ncbi:inorganic phosphate transporter [Oscillospiraceae bacterium MB08-C2-2]|nr:inorganic phosphate transporter [Oscillospiraceae bacterium MB08-C2-2]
MGFLIRGIVLVLVMGAVFVNGWTDAPNAMATAVTTGAISFRRAAGLCAVFNCLGLLVMGLFNSSVTTTITQLIDFGDTQREASLIALCAAMISIVLFAVGAWLFSIPTSESHALIAGITGAVLALRGTQGINRVAWGKVLTGLIWSLLLGALLGWLAFKGLGFLFAGWRKKTVAKAQIASTMVTAFLHGAQDGQKFLAILVVGDALAKHLSPGGPVHPLDHWPLLLLVGLTMALGTLVGGERIVWAVGEKMVSLTPVQGICSDLGAGLGLLAASLLGIPVSTTHIKTAAIMGAGRAGGGRLDKSVAGGMLLAWAITFPVCGLLGFWVTRLMLVLLGA